MTPFKSYTTDEHGRGVEGPQHMNIPINTAQSAAGASPMQGFTTGATRNDDRNQLDFEGFLSPTVLERFAIYMHKNRNTTDGGWRDSDNWQKGIPCDRYMKSMWRHFHSMWKKHRLTIELNDPKDAEAFEDDMCAIMFNVMGYMHEYLKYKEKMKNSPASAMSQWTVEEQRRFMEQFGR